MKEKIKTISKKILAYFIIYVGITMLFVSLIIGAYMLPNTNIRGHIAESVALLKNEGLGYAPLFQNASATLDTHTDALILNIAMNKGMKEGESDIKRAVENSFYEDETKAGVSSLEKNISDGIINNHEYSRYWHGIQVIIRPLLMFFNYSEIRYIFMLMTFILLGVAFSMIGKQLGTKYSIAFATAISLMFVVLIPMSIQYSSIFFVTLVSMIAVMLLYKTKKEKYISLLFFSIGGLATFFDLLTYPLVTLGMPITLAVLLENKKGKKVLEQICFTIKLGLLWGIGYGLWFFTKWIIASIILNKDAVTLAINEILFRVNGKASNPVNRLDAVKDNVGYFFVPVAKQVLILIGVILAILLVLYHKKIRELKNIVPLICIAVVPYAWYIVFAGHSIIHCWFTNKIQAMSVFAVLCAIVYMVDEKNIGKYIKKIKCGGKNETNN